MKLFQCKCGHELETGNIEPHEVACPLCGRLGMVMQMCPACEDYIKDEETCECDACEYEVHVDCGGKGSVVGIETWGCNNCCKYDQVIV